MSAPISVQLYTLRDQSAEDFRAVIERVASIGYAGVEPAGTYGLAPAEFRRLVESTGMRVSSIHVQGRLDSDDGGRIADECAATGAPFLVVPMLPPNKFESVDGIKQMADVLNASAEAAESRGMQLGYHNHYWEFGDVDGRSAYDIFLEALDPRVLIELDIYWAQTAGVDPAAVVHQLGDRARLLHVKDGPCTKTDSMLAVGDGKVDVPAVLGAGTGAEWHIVELDKFDGDMWDAVERSYTYLITNGLSEGRA